MARRTLFGTLSMTYIGSAAALAAAALRAQARPASLRELPRRRGTTGGYCVPQVLNVVMREGIAAWQDLLPPSKKEHLRRWESPPEVGRHYHSVEPRLPSNRPIFSAVLDEFAAFGCPMAGVLPPDGC